MLKLYYKSVNRGLSFTKPGLYSILYVMAIGLLAIVTGINGFYIFMSTGLALLIVSGLISERIMKHSKVTHLESLITNANSPFDIKFTVTNTSKTFTTFGIETTFTIEKPMFRMIAKETHSAFSGKALKIEPDSSATFQARSEGLSRGHHRKIHVAQRTCYPFGFLEKFKIVELPCSLIVTPEINQKLLAELTTDVNRRRILAEATRDFFSHQPYTHLEPLKHIDWKRSAGKPAKDWVVKQFRSEIQNFHYKIVGHWQHALNAATEEAYEAYLGRIATAVKALSSDRSELGLEINKGQVIWKPEHIQTILASAPIYSERARGLDIRDNKDGPLGLCIPVIITPDSFTWRTDTTLEAG
jgi:hypothetical protein